MLRKFEEFGNNPEVSSIIAEPLEYKSTTQNLHKINDSFESSILIKNGSDSSFISQISLDDGFLPSSKLNVYKISKPVQSTKHSRVNSIGNRPASILKTTFLSEDAGNYNFPKKVIIVDPKDQKHEKNFEVLKNPENSESQLLKLQEVRIIDENKNCETYEKNKKYENYENIENYKNYENYENYENFKNYESYKSYENHENKENFEKISELENQILKKDALIETLRSRVSKIVQELEETHKKVSKNPTSEDTQEKLKELSKKNQIHEDQIFELKKQEKDLSSIILKKDQEIHFLDKELKLKKNDLDLHLQKIEILELELKKSEDSKAHIEKMKDHLQIKLENSNNALEMSNSLKIHLEQEVKRLESEKKTQENEMKLAIEENPKQLANLSKKYEDISEESKHYQKLFKEASDRYETLTKDHFELRNKLQSLEEKFYQIEFHQFPRKKDHCRSISNHVTSEDSKFYHNMSDPFSKITDKKKSSSTKALFKEIMDILSVNHIVEVIPTIKKNLLSQKEKKLIAKLKNLVRECFLQDRNGKDASPAYIWKVVKKVFEEFAVLKKAGYAEINMIKGLLGEGNLAEKVAGVCQELKVLHSFAVKIRQKLKLPHSASISEIEAALGIFSL